jgi:hypothetical protein
VTAAAPAKYGRVWQDRPANLCNIVHFAGVGVNEGDLLDTLDTLDSARMIAAHRVQLG